MCVARVVERANRNIQQVQLVRNELNSRHQLLMSLCSSRQSLHKVFSRRQELATTVTPCLCTQHMFILFLVVPTCMASQPPEHGEQPEINLTVRRCCTDCSVQPSTASPCNTVHSKWCANCGAHAPAVARLDTGLDARHLYKMAAATTPERTCNTCNSW